MATSPDGKPIAETQRQQSAVLEAMGVADYVRTISEGAPPDAPVNTTKPFASGEPVVGQTVACTMGTWEAMQDEPHSYAYRWFRNDAAIPDARSETYVVTTADVGAMLACVVQATNPVGDGASASNALGPVE